jgi:uncharacterized paraquat-inducible protein A
MTVPDEAFTMLQNGGFYAMVALVFIVVIFAPLIYIVVLTKGAAHDRLVKIIDAFGRLIRSTKKVRPR